MCLFWLASDLSIPYALRALDARGESGWPRSRLFEASLSRTYLSCGVSEKLRTLGRRCPRGVTKAVCRTTLIVAAHHDRSQYGH
jgi:hypothetical protein